MMIYYDPEAPEAGTVAAPQGTKTTPISLEDYESLFQAEVPKQTVPNPDLLWSLVLSPNHGLPIYQELLQVGDSLAVSVISSTLTGTWKNNVLTLEQKLAATAGALTILKQSLVAINTWSEEKEQVVQDMLDLASFPINMNELE